MDIVMTGYAGDIGSVILSEHYRERLQERLSLSFLCRMKEIGIQAVPEEGEFIIPIGPGGVFAALWELAKVSGMGIAVDMEKIPIRQETIEVCELLEVNPYQLRSGGYLYLRESGESFLSDCMHSVGEKKADSVSERSEGATCGVVIGVTHPGKDKAIRGKEGIRYINRPEPDELVRIGLEIQ